MITTPDGVNVEVSNRTVKVKGPKGEVEKTIIATAKVTVEGKEIKIEEESFAHQRTLQSIINSMVKGVTDGHQKKLKVVYAHFPISVEIKGKEILIKNFQGEKQPRKTTVVGDYTKVQVKGQEITVSGPDKEAVGQTAANLRIITKIKGKDVRIFQDGIYVVEG